jgi:hypothetical protein
VNILANPAMQQNWMLNPHLHRMGEDEDEFADVDANMEEPDFDLPSATQDLETLQMQFEQNVAMKKKERWAGQERWQGRENEEARLVNYLHPNAFMRRLQRAGVDARVEYNEHARLWLNNNSRLGRLGVTAWFRNEETERLSVRTISTLQDGVGPEWSLMYFDRYDVPTAERYRGWRTTLLHLIIANVITEEEADRAFGKPATGEVSEHYREVLQNNRARRMGVRQ